MRALLHLGTMEGNECRGEDERKEASVLNKGISAHACPLSTEHIGRVGGLDIAHGWKWEVRGGGKVTFSVGRGDLVLWVPRGGVDKELEISMDMGPGTPAERPF